MSNPFLVDLDENYTPYTSGISTPFSGAATPTTKRRNSTNPFEILSPEGDEAPVTFTLDNEALQSAANEINNNSNKSSQQPQQQQNVASTIADMTADFYQAITKHDFNFDATINDDVFEEHQSGRLQDDILGDDHVEEEGEEDEEDNNNLLHQLNKPVTTVKTINYNEEEESQGGASSSALFDPFETIHDDDGMSSKRSSVEVSGNTPLVLGSSTTGASSNQTVTELASSLVSANSAKAKELFNSSMASFELLAAGGKPSGNDLLSPMTPTTPPSMEENSAEVGAAANFLTPAPTTGMDVYSSNDLSDLSDVSPTTAADVRSAFNMYSEIDKEVLPSKFEPIADSEIIKRQISVTQGGELEEEGEAEQSSKRPLSDIDTAAAAEGPQKAQSAFKHTPQLISSVSGSVDIFDPGNPNKNAEGIVNDAFDEMATPTAKSTEEPVATAATTNEGSRKSSLILQRKSSLDVAEVDSKNIQPNDLRQLVAPLNQAIEDGGGNNGSVDQEDIEQANKKNDGGDDPFDTSAFDSDAFDAFESRFEATDLSIGKAAGDDPFASPYKTAKGAAASSSDNAFDSFEPFVPKQPENTPFHQASTAKARPAKAKPAKVKKDSFEDSFDSEGDEDSEEEENIKIVIRAKMKDDSAGGNDEPPAIVPLLPPPPKSPRHLPLKLKQSSEAAEGATEDSAANPEDTILMSYRTPYTGIKNKTRKNFIDEEFDRFFNSDARETDSTGGATAGGEEEWPTAFGEAASKSRTGGGDSPASPQTPLYDEDTSQPLEEFPARYIGDGWEMMLRHPAKKKLTANRYWKKVWVRFIPEGCILQLFNKREDVQPFQELPLQASYSLSEVCAQQYDQYGKIFTIKVQYIFYRERVGVRPGQIAKVMQGQIQSMGDFARLGMPVEHAPQVSELLKIGSLDWAEVKQLVTVVEEAMFRLAVHRDRALTYRTEEIQCVVQDELYVEQSKIGVIEKQLARVRVFFLAFLNGIPAIEVGVNDLRRQGKEVVGRHDILPVVTEEWIRVEAPEFHACVQSEIFDQSQVVKLIPPDACHFELMRFRIRPPKNRELPLQVSAYMNITASKMELKCDILVPGCISRKHGQIPCEEIVIRFHIPECWIYFFRVEKHFRMGAVHSTNRRSGKLKGFDRFLGTAANPEPQLIEVTAGQAKYEHAYHSIVWRIPRLPKDGQGAYTQQFMIVRLPLSSFDRIPETFYDYVHVEFHMPSTTVSHTTLRSISIAAGGGENPPEKFVRYNAKYEYKIALSITYDDSKPESEYVAAVALNNGSVKSSSGGGGGGTSDTAGHSSEEDEVVGSGGAAVEVAE